MTTNIQLLRSSIANKRPAPSTLLEGQAAVNLNATEPGLYFKLSSGVLTKVGPTCVNSSGSAPNASPAGSSGNAVGEQWLDARSTLTSPVLKVYDGSTWRPSSGFTVNDANGNFSLNNQITVRNLIANGTGADAYIRLNVGPTTDQSSITAASGMIRYDSTTNEFVGYYGGGSAGWRIIGPTVSTPGNGQINVNVGTGLTVSGTNATANQTGNTTRTISLDTTYSDGRYVLKTGSTMTGLLTLSGDPTANLMAATKQYVDNNVSGAPVAVSSSPPASPAEGDLWWDEDEGKLFVYYTDANSSQWVEASPSNSGSNYVDIGGDTMTGNLTIPSQNTGPLAGLRNVIINGAVTINQRGLTYANAANNAYWADRWKKVTGGMTQIIESGNFKTSTQYTLSGSGVTTQQVTSPASGNWTIPTVAATATNIQMEIGPVATPFEQRPITLELSLCQRYYQLGQGSYRETYPKLQTATYSTIMFPTPMRAAPTFPSPLPYLQNDSSRLNQMDAQKISSYSFVASAQIIGSTGDSVYGRFTWTADAEL